MTKLLFDLNWYGHRDWTNRAWISRHTYEYILNGTLLVITSRLLCKSHGLWFSSQHVLVRVLEYLLFLVTAQRRIVIYLLHLCKVNHVSNDWVFDCDHSPHFMQETVRGLDESTISEAAASPVATFASPTAVKCVPDLFSVLGPAGYLCQLHMFQKDVKWSE